MTQRGFLLERDPESYREGAVRLLTLEADDPIGQYELDVVVNGELIRTFEFEVVE